MEVRLCRAFVAVADAPTLSAAADALSITQPALTKQIQQLERSTGLSLFERGRFGTRLTAIGEQLLPAARDVVERADDLDARTRLIARGETGHLSIGFGLSSITVAPQAVADFRRRFPEVHVALDDMSSAEQAVRIHRGLLDLGFVRLPVEPSLDSLALHEDSLAVAYPAEWGPLPAEAALKDWLEKHQLIGLARDRGPGLSEQVRRWILRIGADVTVVQNARDIQTVLALVAAGIGVAIVPYSARQIAPPSVGLRAIEAPSARWLVGIAWRSAALAPAAKSFLDMLRSGSGSR